MIETIPCICDNTVHGREPRRWGTRGESGLTAIEVMVSLVVLSVVAAFSLQAFEFTRRAHLEVEQLDFAAQMARDVLNQLRHDDDWRVVKEKWEKNAPKGPGTTYEVQIAGEPGEEAGVSNVEVTIIWIGPKGLEQQVFNTSVFDSQVTP